MKILIVAAPLNEDISATPQRYGGVGRTFYLLAKNNPNITIASNWEALRDCDISVSRKIILSEEEERKIVENGDLQGWDNNFDLIFHAQPNRHYVSNKPTLVWAPGYGETINRLNTNILCHNLKNQHPYISNLMTNLYEFVLGVDIPPFQEYKKDDFILQVTNHYPQINSIILAKLCLKHNIKCIFAGPISDGYPLSDYIDNEYTFYEGVIPEERKIELLKKARFFGCLYSHPINDPPLSAKQALSYGCPILTNQIGAMAEFIDGSNGYFIRNEQDFIDAWQRRHEFNQLDCYDSVKNKYSVDNMIKTFNNVCERIINEANGNI